jgi:hypothetical protein
MNNSQSKKIKQQRLLLHAARLSSKTASAVYSIDEKHTEMLNWFSEINDVVIPNLKYEIEKLVGSIKLLNNNQIDEYMDTCDKIRSLRNRLRCIRTPKELHARQLEVYIRVFREQKKYIHRSHQQVNILNSFFN